MAGLFQVDYSGYTPSELAKLDAMGPGTAHAAQQAAEQQNAIYQQVGGAGVRPNGVPSQIEAPMPVDPNRHWAGMNMTQFTPEEINSISALTPEEKTQILNEREMQLANPAGSVKSEALTDNEAKAKGHDVANKTVPGVANPYAMPQQPPVAGARPLGGGAGGGTGQLGALGAQAGKIDDKANKTITASAQGIGDSMGREADIKAGVANEQADAQDQAHKSLIAQDKALALHQADQRIAQARREQTMMREMNKFDDLKNSVATMQEDPDRFYKSEDGSTNYGKKVAAALAIAFGQFGAAMTGGPNMAMQIIEGAIDRDIESQRQSIAKARGDLSDQRGFLADLRQKGFDEQGAADAAKVAMLEDYKRQIDTTLASTKSAETRGAGEAEKEKATQRQHEIAAKAAESVAENEFKAVSTQAGIETNRQQIGLQREQIAGSKAAAASKGQADAQSLAASGLAPRGGVMPDEATVRKAQETKGTIDAMRANLSRLKTLRQENGAEITGLSGESKEMKQLATELRLQYKNLAQLGALSGGDLDMLNDMLPSDPSKIGNVLTQLDSFGQIVDRSAAAKFKAWGLDEAKAYTPSRGKSVQ